ncbi:MAG: acetylornithine/N-succinyldiaminopimelate aminotransferase [Rhodobacteraceae bacterium]|uniref:aspartate aminotransferase family protein n=1 Tax=Cypionkella sp. TaxID=2811411 RepID=UPI00132AD526|nr:aspartate aminotransferase family protein [Cypionkella sp.]KAF0174324.1 MAG: acetylornithine/N-succinyldiaminopimelate aminotransferase [Paracoccaceae bacterium]MDO8326631.1 aspartate aminotransferase family protein [Cypionkella sp.]
MITPVLPTYNRAPIAFVKGEGSWLTAEDGSRYLDLGAGIAVNALGHANPALVAALTEQAGKLWHVSNLYRIPEQENLAEMLVEKTFADTVFFTNSGTEAAELAIKMARKYHYDRDQADRIEIIAFEGAFHGRSTGAIAAAGSEKMVKGFGPLMPGFRQLKWGDHDAIRAAITNKTCAVIIEPVQGEGGIRVVPDQCLKGLRDLCDETGTLLIFDEVQCGMGRTGKLFAHEWAGVYPDIMMVAKGIGGGFPLGAVLATEAAASGMVAGTHGSTYGGNPLGCAVGAAVMQIVSDEAFLDAVSQKAAQFRQGLEGLVASHPSVFEAVRGQGLILGLKCKASNVDVVKAAYAEHLLTVPAADNVLRLLPALNIAQADIAEALARLDRTAARIEAA